MTGTDLVAWNLRRLRVEQGLSQDGLALEAEVDRTYVGRLERSIENPTITILDKLASALGVRVSELLAEPQPVADKPATLRAGRKPKR